MSFNFDLKWTNGEKYEKSPRRQNIPKTIAIENTAYQQSLLSENDNWVINQEGQLFVQGEDQEKEKEKGLNKREDTYNRMAEREMIGQIGMNPFSNNNYLNDVMVQDNFLKPMSTSTEKETEKEKEF